MIYNFYNKRKIYKFLRGTGKHKIFSLPLREIKNTSEPKSATIAGP